MNPIVELRQSFRGWSEIMRGKAGAGQYFRTDPSGVAIAAGWLAIAVLLSVAAQAAALGLPSVAQLAFGLFAEAVTVGMLWLAMRQALGYLKLAARVSRLFVPALYAMGYMFVVSIPLALLGPGVQLLAVLGLAVLMFFAGQTLAGMRPGIAVGFAALCLIVLVVVPNGLYIVFSLFPSSA